MNPLAITGALLLFPLAVRAGLKWEKDSMEVTVEQPEKQVRVTFPFRNETRGEISISDIQTSCSCTLAGDIRGAYRPGAQGELAVTFVVGNRKGRQEASVVVTESDGKTTSHAVLKLRIDLPDTVHLTKERLTWELGDPLEEQKVLLKLDQPGKTRVASVKSVSPLFQVEQEIVGDGEVELRVKPLATDRAVSGALRIELLEPEPRTLFLPLQIR